MIEVTLMNRNKMILNDDHIEKIEEVPDTVITLTNGKRYIAIESKDEIVAKVIEYKKKIFSFGI